MKVFKFISGVASIICLIIAISQWKGSSINSQILFVIAIIATGLLSYLLYVHFRLRSSVVPELIHLKGACALTHELSDTLNTLSQDELSNESVLKILRALSNSTARRIQDISSNNPDLYRVADIVATSFQGIVQIAPLQAKIREAYQAVHRVDRSRLRQEKLESFVYHVAAAASD